MPLNHNDLPETATERLDRVVQAGLVRWTSGLSPVSMSLAFADWLWHISLSPGRQWQLLGLFWTCASQAQAAMSEQLTHCGTQDEDPRFRHEAWTQWPFDRWRCAFAHAEHFWREAAATPGMSAHHAQMTRFFARQYLDWLTPANWLWSNPVLQQDIIESQGQHLLQGWQHLLADMSGETQPTPDPGQDFAVGKDIAITPGQVVYRNRLIELLRYDAQTSEVHPEPLLIVPSWIMKYYILDLEPHNSLVRYLVGQGFTVYMVSWHNPDEQDADLHFDDYLSAGVLDALQAVARLHPPDTPVHAMGYCLGGTLLALAAAAIGRQTPDDQDGASLMGRSHLPALKSLTLLAAQTDFTEPGELGLFIDESQLLFLDKLASGQGYLSGQQMAGSFQFLHSRELFWTRRMRSYLMGVREPASALAAWNADTTRLPARMHHEYLNALYLRNALASSRYRVDKHVVSLDDIRVPVFLLATERDHISPWHSVYKLHRLCDAEMDFVLVSGGHNVGILAQPGHPKSSFRNAHREAHTAWLDPEHWLETAHHQPGSWWPAWSDWLKARSTPALTPPPPAPSQPLGLAPGQYVMERYPRVRL